MTFTPFSGTKSRPARSRRPDIVSVSISKKSGNEKDYSLSMFLGVNVMERAGLKIGDRVSVGIGADHDAGMIQLRADPKGARVIAYSGSKKRADEGASQTGIVTLPIQAIAWLAHIDSQKAAEDTTFQVFGSAVTILVPWAKS